MTVTHMTTLLFFCFKMFLFYEKHCIFAPMFYKLIEKKRDEWLSSPDCKAKNRMSREGRFVPKKRAAIDGKVWWCVYDTVEGCYSKLSCHGVYKTKRSCEIGIGWSIKEYGSILH